jgi:anti-sigma B factor antagonist
MSVTVATSNAPHSNTVRVQPRPDEFVCKLRHDGSGVACVYVAAELDIASASHLEHVLHQAELKARLVVLDLRDLTFMDSFGLRLIATTTERAQRTGRRLTLVRGPRQVERLLALTGADERLEIAELGDFEPAIRALLEIARADKVA